MENSTARSVAARAAVGQGDTSPLARLAELVHRRFLALLIAAYLAAMFWPGAGLAMRKLPLGDVPWLDATITMPALLLAVLLFNAGLEIDSVQLRGLLKRPRWLLSGLAASWLLPPLLVWLLALLWPLGPPRDACLVGLALVAVMPVANSSCAWTQNAGGLISLSLALVLLSTLLTPLATPLSMALLEQGVFAGLPRSLFEQVGQSTAAAFLIVWVTAPVVLGLAVRRLIGPRRSGEALPILKLLNALVLLLLNYSNAALALPALLSGGEPELASVVAMTLLFSVGLFVGAALLGWLLGGNRGQRLALLFGLGMKNSGAALVLAGLTLEALPAAILPIVCCTLWQHLLAGLVDLRFLRRPPAS